MITSLDVLEVADAIGEPVHTWPDRCHEIALAIVATGLAPGSYTRYGLYHGPIAPTGYFANRPLVRHGWIVQVPARGTRYEIIDPTRWVFEDVEPYVYFGPDSDDYDLGAGSTRRGTTPPAFSVTERTYRLDGLDGQTRRFVLGLLRHDTRLVSYSQLFWLANRPPDELGEHAPAIYEWLGCQRLRGLIPIDFYREVEQWVRHEAATP